MIPMSYPEHGFPQTKFPFHQLVEIGDPMLVKAWMSANPEKVKGVINSFNEDDYTPIHKVEFAPSAHKVELIELLALAGANIDEPIYNGRTLLHALALQGQQAAVQKLLELGADVNHASNSHITPLHLSTFSGSLVVTQQLIEQGANVHALTDLSENMVHFAAESGHLHLVQLFWELGVDLHHKNAHNETPLHQAISSEHLSVAQFLIEHQASLNDRTDDGKNAIDLALQSHHQALTSYILGAKLSQDEALALDEVTKPLGLSGLSPGPLAPSKSSDPGQSQKDSSSLSTNNRL